MPNEPSQPLLKLSLVEPIGGAINQAFTNTTHVSRARYYHLRVSNAHRATTTAHRTQVFLVRIDRASGEDFKPVWQGDAVPVWWRYQAEQGLGPQDLGKDAEVDLCVLFADPPASAGTPSLRLRLGFYPVGIMPHVTIVPNVPVILHLQARSDECDSEISRIKISWDGKYAEDNAEMARHLVIEHVTEVVTVADKKKVFIIHGRNIAARIAVEHFLKSLGLDAIDFDVLAADCGTEFVGNIVVKGMEQAHGIVSIFTPDEYASLTPPFRDGSSGTDLHRWQSRPNVIFEAGIAFGTARARTILATLGDDVSLFSDGSGLHLLRLNNTTDSRKKFRQKLIGAGCDVDQRTDAWMDTARAGDFDAAIATGRSGVSPNDPFRI